MEFTYGKIDHTALSDINQAIYNLRSEWRDERFKYMESDRKVRERYQRLEREYRRINSEYNRESNEDMKRKKHEELLEIQSKLDEGNAVQKEALEKNARVFASREGMINDKIDALMKKKEELMASASRRKPESYNNKEDSRNSDIEGAFNILGLSLDSGLDEVKKQYRALARKYHPDVSTEKDAERKFREINQAYSRITESLE